MSDFPLRVIAEIMTKETAAEKAEVLAEYWKHEADMQRAVMEHNDKAIAKMNRQDDQLAALPWYKRIGKNRWDMPG